jgi:hypothetical protein
MVGNGHLGADGLELPGVRSTMAVPLEVKAQ